MTAHESGVRLWNAAKVASQAPLPEGVTEDAEIAALSEFALSCWKRPLTVVRLSAYKLMEAAIDPRHVAPNEREYPVPLSVGSYTTDIYRNLHVLCKTVSALQSAYCTAEFLASSGELTTDFAESSSPMSEIQDLLQSGAAVRFPCYTHLRRAHHPA